MMGMREVGIVCSFLVIASFMVLCRFFVIMRSVLVMFGGFLVMVCCLFLTCGSSCALLLPVYPEDAVGFGHICSPLK